MKLKNLLFGTMVACAFVACSNDDDPTPTPEVDPTEMDATLTVAFKADGAKSGLKSKSIAGISEAANDFDIQTIALAVFNKGAMSPAMADGALISYREITRTGADTTACVSAKSGDVAIMVVANPNSADLQGLTTLTAFQTAVSKAKLSSQKNGALLMSSKVYTLELAKGRNIACSTTDKSEGGLFAEDAALTGDKKVNFITNDGGAYLVYRNVARISLKSITIDPRQDFGEGVGEGAVNYATFQLDSVYIDHVRPNVLVFGNNTNDWNSVKDDESDGLFLTGLLDPSYTGSNYLLDDFTKKNKTATYTGNASTAVIKETKGYLSEYYVYDNSATAALTANTGTRLVIKGTYTYKTGNGTSESEVIKSEHAYWYFDINEAGQTPNGTSDKWPAHYGVLRNMQYEIEATITGPCQGIDPTEPETPPTDPDTPVNPTDPTTPPDGSKACIKVKVEVAPWGTVTDEPVID